jgi:uncharacterized protein (DUF169 family)
MSNERAAHAIVDSLNLRMPPIALSFTNEAPAEAIAPLTKPMPSACSFWRAAETEVFYASAAAHFNCPVGAMIMGFDLPKPVSDELGQLVGTMGNCGYISPNEPPRIPVSKKKAQGIVYGPLSRFPTTPDIVLCWVTPSQAMIWNEAAGASDWSSENPGATLGRPACAALPASVEKDRPVISFGCMGMRTFTEIADDLLLAVLPGTKLEEFADKLLSLRRINDTMASFYVSRKGALSATA